jgi:hypothetical protein
MRRTMWLLALWAVSCSAPDTEYCQDDGDCALIVGSSEFGAICHPSRHVCISALSCREDKDCQNPEASRCDIATNTCQPCLPDGGDDSCSHFNDKRLCAKKGSAGVCVGCLSNIDCSASAPICDGQSCRKCQRHSDCEGKLYCDDGVLCTDSMVCLSAADFGPTSLSLDGRCAQNDDGPGGRVVYVHDDPKSCSSGAKGTLVSQPFCKFEEGVAGAVALSRPYVRVIAQSEYATPTTWSVKSGQFLFIGAPSPTRGIGKPAVLDFSNSRLDVSETGNVTLDGFELTAGAFHHQIVTCSATTAPVPALTLRNNLVRGKAPSSATIVRVAIDIENCQARIQNNVIGVASLTELEDPNHLAHLRVLRIANSTSVPGTSILIENNLIAGNWDNAIDMEQVATPGVTLRFNTIYGNDLRAGLLKTIRCSSVGPYVTIAQSIVQRAPAATSNLFEYATNCRFKQVAVGMQANEITDPELIRDPPQLGDTFELSANGNSCCIDRAQPGASEMFPTTDLAQRARPQGAGFELGAYELPGAR